MKLERAIPAIPFIAFALLATAFAVQILSGDPPDEIPSALIGKKVPEFSLTPMEDSSIPNLSRNSLLPPGNEGKISIVNVWASWCVPCREEHPLLMELAKTPEVRVVGINYKDHPDNALRFLGELGNPFDAIGTDPRGSAAIEWGVYGIPETFIIDAKGQILHRHVGPLQRGAAPLKTPQGG